MNRVKASDSNAQVLAEIAPNGVLRAAINLGNSVLAQRAQSGELKGVSVDLAFELGRQLGVQVELVSFDAAGKVIEAMASNRWDVAFLAIDPLRGQELAFTPAYVLIEGAYMVRKDAPWQSSAEIDQPGMRVTVGKGSAYDLHLSRNLQHAQIERHTSAAEAFASFLENNLEAAAGVRQVLDAFSLKQAGLRVLDDSFMTICQALAVRKDRTATAAYLSCFIEDKKADGSVAALLQRYGQTGARVAPAVDGNDASVMVECSKGKIK